MEIDVLGTTYTMTEEYAADNPVLEDCNGVMDFTSKKISIRKYALEEERLDTNDNPAFTIAQAKRHELIHAFLFESGLESYAHDETLVDWLSIQFFKLYRAFIEAEAYAVTVKPGAAYVKDSKRSDELLAEYIIRSVLEDPRR